MAPTPEEEFAHICCDAAASAGHQDEAEWWAFEVKRLQDEHPDG